MSTTPIGPAQAADLPFLRALRDEAASRRSGDRPAIDERTSELVDAR